ncbi:acyl-CoA ligase (AMP-forming), exosortase A system-associated [Duganella sp. FT27W]|uniref:acyl-CoA ligase (AMP-forming), exosortase A system-associated n=1 Tax=Duganella sp. FT27W TaxID=2654636 RepID=UPI00128BB881|nr:acyl-CoA ligase (AMP-forming), exosortase A system-associated [Duganella sp. FT27W]MPQ56046.1 acyl-CoA ligase (AMP-forming), exosortase A system-associated [Duganella sp. FT27W]
MTPIVPQLVPQLLHDLIYQSAYRMPQRHALAHDGDVLTYDVLAGQVKVAADAWLGAGMARGERVAVYLEKREEAVVAMFGAAAAGLVFVPINPVLKTAQVVHILRDCNVRLLVTSPERLATLAMDGELAKCADLHTVVLAGPLAGVGPVEGVRLLGWQAAMQGSSPRAPHAVIDADMAAILYTSGSTGRPKGVVLSHRNLVAGALSVSAYLHNVPEDRILCVLPLSFDYGLSQLTTAFAVGACAVLQNHLLVRDVIETVARERITGLAAVPPLWIQLAALGWSNARHLRYITNSGGVMQRSTLQALQAALPRTRVYLMYGLTEAFRSTYLPPEELGRRPDSIGKAIPNAEILVLRPDGSRCAPDEPGELVHRGALVSLGYWNDPARTAQRFRPLRDPSGGLPLPDMAVWSGDTVRVDTEGFLYFIGRSDDMIKTSGYRVSPSEVEEVVYDTGLVAEAVAIGMPHPLLGQSIALVVCIKADIDAGETELLAACRRTLPSYMVPLQIELRDEPLPRNPNGKLDRVCIATELAAGVRAAEQVAS